MSSMLKNCSRKGINLQKSIHPGAFEKVFAVLDRDEHTTYFDALTMAHSLSGRLRNDAKQPIDFQAIASVPCFELWPLLHYQEILAPICRDDLIRRLKKHIHDYEKGASGVFELTRPLLAIAAGQAKSLKQRFTAHDAPQPFTGIVDLVDLLIGLARKPAQEVPA